MAGGGLGLDPENDPIVATTDWGLDIKFHADWGSFGTSVNSGGVAGYCYFTMGAYNGTAVNWVIIGRATNVAQRLYFNGSYSSLGTKYGTYTASDYPTYSTTNATYYKNYQYETTTDAGSVISSVGSKGLVYDIANVLFANSVANAEIPSGCVLCLSEKSIIDTAFYTKNLNHNNYDGSNLQAQIFTLYSSALGLSSAQKSKIQLQNLKTYYSDYPNTQLVSNLNEYLFPLAGSQQYSDENFHVETYLTTDARRIAYSLGTTTTVSWWTRTGHYSNFDTSAWISETGGVHETKYNGLITKTLGVRPAFVLKL